jgi:methionine-R-sulfoxide reductase
MYQKSDKYWKEKLTKEQYHVLREKGTDAPFLGKYTNTHEEGTYSCAACDHPLFTSDQKFDSHCGWPSFFTEMAGANILKTEDNSLGMKRTEITCANCGGHLGHLFDDGPEPTGLRYCVNSSSINFTPKQ